MYGRAIFLVLVTWVAAGISGCARLNNLNWSLEAVDIDKISETEHALEISGTVVCDGAAAGSDSESEAAATRATGTDS